MCHGLMLHHLHQPAWWAETNMECSIHHGGSFRGSQSRLLTQDSFLAIVSGVCVCVCHQGYCKAWFDTLVVHQSINRAYRPCSCDKTTIPLGFPPQEGWCIPSHSHSHNHNHSHHRQSYFHHIPHTLRYEDPHRWLCVCPGLVYRVLYSTGAGVFIAGAIVSGTDRNRNGNGNGNANGNGNHPISFEMNWIVVD